MDSNFLFIPFQFRVDIFEELSRLLGGYEPIVLSTTIKELKGLVRSGSEKVGRLASSALSLTNKCRIMEVERRLGETYDDVIVRVAKEIGCAVATNDHELRKRLRREGITTIFLRERSHLELEGYV